MYNKIRGDKSLALEIAADPSLRAEALVQYDKDVKSVGETSHTPQL